MKFEKFKIPEGSKNNSTGKAAALLKSLDIIPLSIFTLMALIFTVFLCFKIWDSVEPNFWPTTEAKILSSEIILGNSSQQPNHKIKISYSYLFKNREYASNKLSRNNVDFAKIENAEFELAKFPPGETVTCMVNPENPQEAYLIANSPWLATVILFPLAFTIVGIVTLIYSQKRKKPEKPTKEKKSSKKRTPGLLILGLVFVSLGWLSFNSTTYSPLQKIEAAKSWEETPCNIISSFVRVHDGDDNVFYTVNILYSYSIDGKTYKSDRYDFFGNSFKNRADARSIVRRYKESSQSKCYVNPLDSGEAVLCREPSPKLWEGLIGAVFMMIGIIPIVAFFLMPEKKRRS